MIEKAIQWIRDNTIPREGIVITSKREVCYPEVTGYYIPTLLSLGEDKLAHQEARWLVSAQFTNGSFGLDDKGYAF